MLTLSYATDSLALAIPAAVLLVKFRVDLQGGCFICNTEGTCKVYLEQKENCERLGVCVSVVLFRYTDETQMTVKE